MNYRERFKSAGQNVIVEENVFIEHPELIEVGDNVRFARGLYIQDAPILRIGSNVTFYPNCFLQGRGRVEIADHVDFFPGTYVSTGDASSLIEVAHHSHFAPMCVLYGWGGLKIGPYCNIAAHCVFATIGHDPLIRGEKPMAEPPYVARPITLEEDIWLGANVTITSGVKIARGCIVGANAVVTRNCDQPYSLYTGVPARRLRDRKRLQTADERR